MILCQIVIKQWTQGSQRSYLLGKMRSLHAVSSCMSLTKGLNATSFDIILSWWCSINGIFFPPCISSVKPHDSPRKEVPPQQRSLLMDQCLGIEEFPKDSSFKRGARIWTCVSDADMWVTAKGSLAGTTCRGSASAVGTACFRKPLPVSLVT